MNILVINSGSSSIKIHVFNLQTLEETKTLNYEFSTNQDKKFDFHLKQAIHKINIHNLEFEFIAHRVVHGGQKYKHPVLITKQVEQDIQKLADLAPLHNPINLKAILFCKKYFQKPQLAVFDTSFFHNLPKISQIYPIPISLYKEEKIQKYGFHGISHKYLLDESCKIIKKTKPNGITVHIGNGVSITAFYEGQPIETSMGFTPSAGCMMGTRSGDIDPGILVYLSQKYKKLDLNDLINKKSGLYGLVGTHHMKEIHDLSLSNHQAAKLAIEIFSYKLAKQISSVFGLLPSCDFITFSGGIGFNARYIRQAIYEYLPGLKLPQPIVIQTNEALQIAKECKEIYNQF